MKKILLSSVAAAIVATSSMAGTITFTDDAAAGAITTAVEGLGVTKAANIDLDPAVVTPLGTALGANIIYTPGIALVDNDVVTINMNNAKFMDADYYLLLDEITDGVDYNGDADSSDVIEAGQLVSAADAVNGVSSIQMRMTAGFNLAPTSVMVLASSNAQANTGGVAYDQTDNPLIKLDSSFSASSTVTLTVSDAQNAGGIALSGANTAAAATLIDAESQFAFTFAQGTSQIDAQTNRLNFAEEGGADDIETSTNDTDLTQSAGTITFNNDADTTVEDFVLDANLGQIDLVLEDASKSFAGVDLTATIFDDTTTAWNDGANGTDSAAFTALTATTAGLTLALADIPTYGSTATEDIIVTVDGATALDTRTISLGATLNLPANYTDVSASSSDFLTWTINGYQAYVPYISATSDTVTYMKFHNDAAVAGDVIITLTDDSGVDVDLETPVATGASAYAQVASGASVLFDSNSLLTQARAVNGAFAADGKFRALVTITVPKANVYGTAIQQISGGRDRILPISNDDATATNYKNH